MRRRPATKVEIHDLKIWPRFFPAVLDGRKRAEVRRDDRDFKVGDWLRLCEWDPEDQKYTGREVLRRIRYLTRPLPGADGLVLLEIEDGVVGEAPE